MSAAQESFEWPVRVYVEDTDAGGIVFYANYLKFFERARTEWVRARGISLRSGLEEGISFVVHSLQMQYHQPAYLDDQLGITADLITVGRSYMVFRQQAWRQGDNTLLASGEVKVACVQLPAGRPRKFPEALKAVLQVPVTANHHQ
ncbi:MAG: tol-pal system-associated acyl-CoA thioesterase [Halomonadaceae bacterium]|nr:MAG: tol-pal system-associated acyl-CoA thioesterase [Halomonadaceae bacterium]